MSGVLRCEAATENDTDNLLWKGKLPFHGPHKKLLVENLSWIKKHLAYLTAELKHLNYLGHNIFFLLI